MAAEAARPNAWVEGGPTQATMPARRCRNSSRTGDKSLHAAVRCGADQRQALEQLCRTITRPAIANERLKRNRPGQVVWIYPESTDG